MEKRGSSSSEDDALDLSDETNMLSNLFLDGNASQEQRLPPPEADQQRRASKDRTTRRRPQNVSKQRNKTDVVPFTSRGTGAVRDFMVDPDDQADNMIRLSERKKAVTFPPAGEMNIPNFDSNKFAFVAHMDQDYTVVGAHVDEATQDRIIEGQYVDFSKLLPKDKILTEEEGNKMEIIIKNGKTFWMPVAETVAINMFNKWEQAFRVFSNIYTRAYPSRAGELIEYNHVIHSISLSFIWENVYAYDKDFHLHLARHPQRSWAIILQQAWSMRLRDRIIRHDTPNSRQQHQQFNSSGENFNANKSTSLTADYCRRFNKGKCNLGKSCHYEHRCSYCNKFGHGVIVCRKLIFDKEKSSKNSKGSHGKNNHGHHGSKSMD